MLFRVRGLSPTSLILFSIFFTCAEVAQSETQEALAPVVLKTRVLGRELSVESSGTALPSGLGVQSALQSSFLGHPSEIVRMSVEASPQSELSSDSSASSADPKTPGVGLGRTDLYIHGIRVWTGDLRFSHGGLEYLGGVTPTQIPFPLFVYPLGPLLLRLDAGIEFEGGLKASLLPGVSLPITDSTLDAKVEADLSAAGFCQGYGTLSMVRGGVGGRVRLVDGTTGVQAHLYFNGRKPEAAYLGKVVLLSGDLYGFVDTRFFFGRWNRVLNRSFFSWPGKCYDFGAETCARP